MWNLLHTLNVNPVQCIPVTSLQCKLELQQYIDFTIHHDCGLSDTQINTNSDVVIHHMIVTKESVHLW